MDALRYLLYGVTFGLAAGLAPGPLLTLVIRETIMHGRRQGALVAFAPLITDLPIILVSVLVLSRLSGQNAVLGAFSLLGAAFISYLAYESIAVRGIEPDMKVQGSFGRGIVTNALSPHPYIFWIAVGAPTVLSAYSLSLSASALFVLGFYISLVGSKCAVAHLTERSKSFLNSSIYVYIIRLLGVALAVFAVKFALDGLKLLGVLSG